MFLFPLSCLYFTHFLFSLEHKSLFFPHSVHKSTPFSRLLIFELIFTIYGQKTSTLTFHSNKYQYISFITYSIHFYNCILFITILMFKRFPLYLCQNHNSILCVLHHVRPLYIINKYHLNQHDAHVIIL